MHDPALRKLAPSEFPPLLREIPEPPETLYIRGALPPQTLKLLTVVGSRRMSSYGKDACAHLIAGLSGYPIVIVSGLALGIDGVAHRAALQAHLPTIAIPGSGLSENVLYPRSHVRLAHEIVANGGCLLSEFEPDQEATPYTFPKRNRLMAGIAHATLVIEAGIKSGTLITARLAADYNRDLLAVPHSIFADGGAGGHLFMKLGAIPVRTSEDILDALHIPHETPREVVTLTPVEQMFYDALASPLPRDELIRVLQMSASEASIILMRMELKGLIVESGGMIRRK